jgi:hypothetical protein
LMSTPVATTDTRMMPPKVAPTMMVLASASTFSRSHTPGSQVLTRFSPVMGAIRACCVGGLGSPTAKSASACSPCGWVAGLSH